MFEIQQQIPSSFFIKSNKRCLCIYLHSDGQSLSTIEFWPTREHAQAVLDKFYPEPKHEWEHGDVFRSNGMDHGQTMVYLHPEKRYEKRKPSVVYVSSDTYAYSEVDVYLIGAKFLFNIKDILKEKL